MQESKNIKTVDVINLEKGLYIISTPIGNLKDISIRAEETLKSVDFIICENPIHSLKLLNNLGIKKKLFSLHDYNENTLIKRIEKFQYNCSIALISDAGSPLISDPGYNLVLDYIKKNIKITTIPGPSSIISALQLSGLPVNNFIFFGFVPKNQSQMKTIISEAENLTMTSIFFISGKRIISFLEAWDENNKKRLIAVCKEITKKNERVFRGFSREIIDNMNSDTNNLRGEFVVLVDSVEKKSKKMNNPIVEKEMRKMLEKNSLTEVVEIVHKLTGISKKEIYKTALLIKND
jgi:16S rRNA (cytidine1402-2'-O)-methyltransferase